MDTNFDVSEWQPTRPPEPGDLDLNINDLNSLCVKLRVQTKDICDFPYDPNTWLRRANTLTRLRYPELALGDAYKAGTLSRAHLSGLDNGDSGWRLGNRMGFWMSDEQPEDEVRLEEQQEYLAKLQARAHKIEVDNMYFFPNYEEGRYLMRQYPWMDPIHRSRSDQLLDSINQEFTDNVTNRCHTGPYCEARRHAFGKGDGTSDVLGVFAACDIEQGEIVLVDNTTVFGCNGPSRNGVWTNLEGSIGGCYDEIHPNLEDEDSDQDIRWIRDRAGKHAASVILICRLLLSCIQDEVLHPLDHSLVARLTATYRKEKVQNLSLLNDIMLPNEALQQFGIDIFANHSYDTWVLFTIAARERNNSCGDPIADSLHPLFSLINHSCEPNVSWSTSQNHRTIRVKANKSIKEGEQLLVEYDGFVQDQPLQVRRKRMWKWLDGPCQCTRCVREEKETGVLSSMHSDLAKNVPVWDVEDKPVFPEDIFNLKN